MHDQDTAQPAGVESDLEARAAAVVDLWTRLRAEIHSAIVGQDALVRELVTGLLAGGHVLIEGLPGLGKTLLVRTMARALKLSFQRIQFTPDLMPADIIGTNVVMEDPDGRKRFEFQPGPVFGQVILADEVNRATPKTQSALLQAMQEHEVTVSRTTHRLEEPFFVVATENPIEMEGTYPLPEAQLDRFLLQSDVPAPSEAALTEILVQTTGASSAEVSPVAGEAEIRSAQALVRALPCHRAVLSYAARLALAASPHHASAPTIVRQHVRYGPSPRGAQALVLTAKVHALVGGRLHTGFDDLEAFWKPALRHRLLLRLEAVADGVRPDDILDEVLRSVPREPRG